MSDYDRIYEDADERERAADWDDHVRHWEQERQDKLTRDQGESGTRRKARAAQSGGDTTRKEKER